MAVETIDTKPVSAAPAPAREAPPAQSDKPAPPVDTKDDKDTTERPRPRVDPCWPPPFHSALAGIAQLRPICYSLQRFGGRDAK